MRYRHKAIQRQTTVLMVLIAGLSIAVFFIWDAIALFPSFLIAMNAVTFVSFAFDKAIAAREYTRVPERTLFSLALLGGSPAALIAMFVFRHKVSKRAFRRVIGAISCVHVAAYIAWFIWFR